MSTENFFVRLFNAIFHSNDPAVIKKKQLTKIAKHVSKTKFSKWYKAGSQELTRHCADFFYKVYRVVGPSRGLMTAALSSQVLKTLAVEQFLSAEQKAVIASLSEKSIQEAQIKMTAEQLEQAVGQRIAVLQKSFTAVQTEKTNKLYQQITDFIDLATFDYYYFLKRFDYNLKELNFQVPPDFKNAKGNTVVENFAEFTEILKGIDFDADWDIVFSVIEKYKNIKPVNTAAWKKTADALRALQLSEACENICRLIKEAPEIKFADAELPKDISAEYMKQVVNSAEKTLAAIKRTRDNYNINALVQKIFGVTNPPSGTKNYTVERNKIFIGSRVAGFMYAPALSYLKSFLIEYYKTEVRAISDLFLVRATWENPDDVHAYSESYHLLLELVNKVIAFDESLKEGEELAMQIKAALARSARDQNALSFVVRKTNELNTTAYQMVVSACRELLVIARLFQAIVEDYDRPRRTLIKNWHEIESNTPKEPRPWLMSVYTKIADFIRLEQYLLQKK